MAPLKLDSLILETVMPSETEVDAEATMSDAGISSWLVADESGVMETDARLRLPPAIVKKE